MKKKSATPRGTYLARRAFELEMGI